jgi:hypothetical protein
VTIVGAVQRPDGVRPIVIFNRAGAGGTGSPPATA